MNEHASRPDQARAFWAVGPGVGSIRTATLAQPGGGDLLVRTRYSGVSRGSESLVFHGRVPAGEHQRMRAPFQRGDFPFPVQYGYACVGRVEQGPDAQLGDTVFCLHPHQDRFVVPADAVVSLPADVPPQRAILAANAETALNAIWDSGAAPGDRITVVGGGVVGLLIAWLAARLPGTIVTLVDINPSRDELARHLGAGFTTPDAPAADQDLVFHCSGQAAGLNTSLACAGFEARVIEMSWYGDREVPVALGGAFHARRLQIRASQVGHVPPNRRARWSRSRRMELAISLLADDRLDALIDDESGFDQLPDRMPDILADDATGLCHRVVYPDEP